ncbi:MAG: hypothetical protein ACI8RZ_007699 [Myxococcota bacterium]|jgi:hypothetical protein
MQRVILAAGILGPASVVSYAIQRLIDAQGEPVGVLLTTHIPYFWRISMAGLHGLTVAALIATLARQPERWLSRLPVAVLLSTLLSAVAMCLRP